jgi:hypothetical protein
MRLCYADAWHPLVQGYLNECRKPCKCTEEHDARCEEQHDKFLDELRAGARTADKKAAVARVNENVRAEFKRHYPRHDDGRTLRLVELEELTGIDVTILSHFLNEGRNLLFENLLILIRKFELNVQNVFQPVQLEVYGFLAAWAYVLREMKNGETQDKRDESPEHEHYWCLRRILEEPGWISTRARRDEDGMQAMKNRVLRKVRGDLGAALQHFHGPQGLFRLVDAWGQSFVITNELLG